MSIKKGEKMISVIIPVYNTEKYLRRCIDSVLGSDYSDFEILLINDGSTDGSPGICLEYALKDSRIKVFHQENQGVSAARNSGIEKACGEWIVFVDSDDYISKDFLGIIAQEEYKGYDFLLFDYASSAKDDAPSAHPPKPLFLKGRQMLKLVKRILVPRRLIPQGNADFRSPCARAFKKSIIDQYSIHFSTRLTIGEDLLFNMEYQLKARSCVYIPSTVYFYDIHTGSATHGFKAGLFRNHERLLKDLKQLLEDNHMLSLLEKEYYSYALENMTYVLVWEIFSPLSPRPYRVNRRLCQRLMKNSIYRRALRYNQKTGILPRKVLVFFVRARCWPVTALICRISFSYLNGKSSL